MPKQAIFLDRDGCLIEEKNYLSKTEDLKIFDFSFNAIKILKENNFLVFVLTNQSGIARGYFTENDVKMIHDEIQNQFMGHGIKIDEFYYCPHYKNGKIKKYAIECDCRKPKIGLIKQVLKDYPDIDLTKSYVIGDKFSDVKMAINAGCKGILVKTGHGREELSNPPSDVIHYKIFENLYEAAIFISSNKSKLPA